MMIWIRLLMERRFETDRYTIMPPNFLVFHVLEYGFDWRAFMYGIATYLDFMVPWWDVDTVYMRIHSFSNNWLLANCDWSQWKSIFMTVSVGVLMKGLIQMERLANLRLGWKKFRQN
uniref:Uncharacterized protein n=1 Tax=Lactuca sativa TaxID=4236 RepID=A0A9R1WBS3_LACSA|nr:hypothetical protein LSAT_V11C200091050 [Lactuca sativa]